jgi:hypothetical protein
MVNSEIHHIDIRQHANCHQPSTNLSQYQKGMYCLGVKCLFYIKMESDNPKIFKLILQSFFVKIPFIV